MPQTPSFFIPRGLLLYNRLVGQRLSLRSGAASATQLVGRQIVLEDYKFDPTISAKLRHADSLLPRAIYGSFAWKRYATPHSSFTNLCDDAIYSAAFHQLVVAAARFELDGNTLPNEFWRITDELAALFDVADDYADWRRDPS